MNKFKSFNSHKQQLAEYFHVKDSMVEVVESFISEINPFSDVTFNVDQVCLTSNTFVLCIEEDTNALIGRQVNCFSMVEKSIYQPNNGLLIKILTELRTNFRQSQAD